MQADKNTKKCKIEVLKDVTSFGVKPSVGFLLGFDRQIDSTGMHLAIKNVNTMGFEIINIHCNIISGVKDNGNDKDRIEYIEFNI